MKCDVALSITKPGIGWFNFSDFRINNLKPV